jgi:hypothetical protein
MNPQRAFARKIVYGVAICVLLLPLYLLARPTSVDHPGGKLAQLREAGGLSQVQLGEIDPASETIKLATLGMRGVAANILWSKAANYKKKKDWTNLSATLNQITRLEPNFLAVWRHQAWNLSYNVSAEFDDYRHRYRWVIAGIEFLIRGVTYNEYQPRLYWDVGWCAAQKIGRADESKQFRVMFKEDEEFHKRHKTPSIDERDNWLVGKKWFRRAEDLVKKGADMRGMSEVVFFSNSPMCQMNYAESQEEDGIFGEKAGSYWRRAASEWSEFGDYPISTSWEDEDGKIVQLYLNRQKEFTKEAARLRSELDSLDPGLRERIQMERWGELSDEELGAMHYMLGHDSAAADEVLSSLLVQLDKRQANWREALLPKRKANFTDEQNAALNVPSRLRTKGQSHLAKVAEGELFKTAYRVKYKLNVKHRDVARRLQGAKRSQAEKLASEIKKNETMAYRIAKYQEIVNFEYWRRRAAIEQTPEALEARSFIYDARQSASQALLPKASEEYKAGTAKWAELMNQPEFAVLEKDTSMADTLMGIISGYMGVLEKRDELFPEDFALQDYLGAQVEQGTGIHAARESIAAGDKALASGDLDLAKEQYEQGLAKWQTQLLGAPYLILMANREIGEEILAAISGYAEILEKRGEMFPENFVLLDFFHLQVDHAPELLNARLAIVEGRGLFTQSKFPAAQEAYDRGLAEWRKLLDAYPALTRSADKAFVRELTDVLRTYQEILNLRGKKLPPDFILRDFLEAQNLVGR